MRSEKEKPKPKYEAPVLIPLDELAVGGNCSLGTVPQGVCKIGDGGGGACNNGFAATGNCGLGSEP